MQVLEDQIANLGTMPIDAYLLVVKGLDGQTKPWHMKLNLLYPTWCKKLGVKKGEKIWYHSMSKGATTMMNDESSYQKMMMTARYDPRLYVKVETMMIGMQKRAHENVFQETWAKIINLHYCSSLICRKTYYLPTYLPTQRPSRSNLQQPSILCELLLKNFYRIPSRSKKKKGNVSDYELSCLKSIVVFQPALKKDHVYLRLLPFI